MPSIEISLSSDDSPCPNGNRPRSGSTSNADNITCMALHPEHDMQDCSDLTFYVANHMNAAPGTGSATGHALEEHSITISETNRHFHDIIEINDEIEDEDEVLVPDDSSSILDIHGAAAATHPWEHRRRRRSSRRNSGGAIHRFASMVQQNFASRALPPAQELRRVRPFEVHFVEHRI